MAALRAIGLSCRTAASVSASNATATHSGRSSSPHRHSRARAQLPTLTSSSSSSSSSSKRNSSSSAANAILNKHIIFNGISTKSLLPIQHRSFTSTTTAAAAAAAAEQTAADITTDPNLLNTLPATPPLPLPESSESFSTTHSSSQQSSHSSGSSGSQTSNNRYIALGLVTGTGIYFLCNRSAQAEPSTAPIVPILEEEEQQRTRSSSATTSNGTGSSTAAASPQPAQESKLTNPGRYEEISRPHKEIASLETVDGLRVEISMPLNAQQEKQFFLQHSFHQGIPGSLGTYELGANLYMEKAVQSLFSARSNFSDTTNGLVRVMSPNKSLGMRFQVSPMYTGHTLDAEYMGDDYTVSFKFSDLALLQLQYLQRITTLWTAGSEIMYVVPQQRPLLTGLVKYTSPDKREEVIASGGEHGMIEASYLRKASENLSLCTDFAYNSMYSDSRMSLGWVATLPNATVKSSIDTNLRVASMLELSPFQSGIKLQLYAEIDHSAPAPTQDMSTQDRSQKVGFQVQVELGTA